MTTLPSLREGRQLIRALDELETATLVATTRPSAGRAPPMQQMVKAIYADYQRALSGVTNPQLRADGTTFANLSDQARRLRGPAEGSIRGEPSTSRPPRTPQPRTIEPDVVDRIDRYSHDLQAIVDHGSTRRSALRPRIATRSVVDGPPTIRASSLSPMEARKVRLAHELGTTPVTAWTVVTLSGDVVSAVARAGDPAFVRFHGLLAADSFAYWRSLISNVAQLISTLIGLVLGLIHLGTRPDIPSAKELPSRLNHARKMSFIWLYRETQELIGQGDKVFETGPDAALRSLLQPNGTMTTHVQEQAFADAALLRRHTANIDAWLHRLFQGWKAANALLQLLATGTLVLVAGAEFAKQGWDDVWHALLRLVVATFAGLVVRGATAAGLRRLIFGPIKAIRVQPYRKVCAGARADDCSKACGLGATPGGYDLRKLLVASTPRINASRQTSAPSDLVKEPGPCQSRDPD